MPLIAADTRNGGLERPDVLVHALAQLPDELSLSLQADPGAGSRTQALADAYGIAERVTINSGAVAGEDVRIEAVGSAPEGAVRPWLNLRILGAGRDPIHARSFAELVEALYGARDQPASSARGPDDLFQSRRIAVVTNVPNHYRVPLWNRVSSRLRSAGGQLHVLFAGGDPRASRPWVRYPEPRFDHEFLRTRRGTGRTTVPAGLEAALRRFRPHLVLAPGFSPFVSGRIASFAAGAGVPFGIWSGETARQATARSWPRRLERRWLARRADFGLAYGWLAGEYLRGLSPALPFVLARNTAPVPDRDGPPAGSGGSVQFLAVAQAIPRKGLDVAVDAFLRLDGVPCALTVVGAGSQLDALRVRAAGSDRVRFLGAIESDRVLECFRAADAFLFPSRSDVFGLALVEAMGGGLPTITAAAPGAVPDLSVDGHNCIVVDGDDPERWSLAVRRLVEDPGLRAALGRNARRTISRRWTLEHSADAWFAAFRLGLGALDSP